MRVQIDETWSDHEPSRVEHGPAAERRLRDGGDAAFANAHRPDGVEPCLRVDDAPAGQNDVKSAAVGDAGGGSLGGGEGRGGQRAEQEPARGYTRVTCHVCSRVNLHHCRGGSRWFGGEGEGGAP